jgi:hypothetical protein
MTATVILAPTAAAETVCHEEQLRIWANDLVGLLSMESYLREDLDYSDGVDLEGVVMREIKKIVESAFDHPEARTIRRIR